MSKRKDKHHPNKTPAPSNGFPGAEGNPAEQKKAKKRFWSDYEPIEKFNLMLVIFTGIYSAISLGSFYIARGDLAVARESMRVSERPYVEMENNAVDPSGPKFEFVTEPNGQPELNIWFYNSGNTPARRCYVNVGNDATKYLHLTPAGTRRKDLENAAQKANGSPVLTVFGPGESIARNSDGEIVSFIPGSTIAAHSDLPLNVNGPGPADTTALRNSGKSRTATGNLEYMNIFGEYCCETFTLAWDPTKSAFKYTSLTPPKAQYCSPSMPNICVDKTIPTDTAPISQK